jgi:hypothetical protein
MVTVKITISLHMTLCSLVDMYHTLGGTCCLEHQGVFKIETEDSSRILVDTYHVEWHHIAEDCDLQGECWLSWQFIKLNDVLLDSYFSKCNVTLSITLAPFEIHI